MIDNDVSNTAQDMGRDYEFFNQEEAAQIASIGEEEWKIK